jgi:alkylated DNA repair dioxygenase AlkB
MTGKSPTLEYAPWGVVVVRGYLRDDDRRAIATELLAPVPASQTETRMDGAYDPERGHPAIVHHYRYYGAPEKDHVEPMLTLTHMRRVKHDLLASLDMDKWRATIPARTGHLWERAFPFPDIDAERDVALRSILAIAYRDGDFFPAHLDFESWTLSLTLGASATLTYHHVHSESERTKHAVRVNDGDLVFFSGNHLKHAVATVTADATPRWFSDCVTAAPPRTHSAARPVCRLNVQARAYVTGS